MRFTDKLCWTVAISVAVTSFLAPALLPSQQAWAERDEITVTARKREEDLQSVPISITAFTEEDLRVRGIVDLETLADQTPGLSFGTSGAVTSVTDMSGNCLHLKSNLSERKI